MSINHRMITVGADNPVWQEYDREVRIELWHNANQVTPLYLNRQEARDLQALLTEYLEAVPTGAASLIQGEK